MAKRSRGAARPGQRPQQTRRPQPQRPAGRGGAATTDAARPAARPVVDDQDELELETDERLGAAASRSRRDRAEPAAQVRARGAQPSGLLAARAAEEYGYVAKDVRHIAVVGGGLLVILLVLWVLIEVARVIPIGSR